MPATGRGSEAGAAEVHGRGGKAGPFAAAVLGTVAAALLGYGFLKHGISVFQRLLALVAGFLSLFVALAAVFSRLVLGAALGLPVGLALAVLATRGPSSYGLQLSVPVPSLLTFVVLSLVVGVLAAVLPARRAGKLNVLAALSYE